MAVDDTQVLVGAGEVSIADWVTAGAATGFADIGHTKEPVTLQGSFEDFEVTSERALSPIKVVPIKGDINLVVPFLEMKGKHWIWAFRQASTNRSGTAPLETVRIGQHLEKYHTIRVVGPAVGAANERTFTFWKCAVASMAELPIAKADVQVLAMTFKVLYDGSIATTDKYFKWVEAAAA